MNMDLLTLAALAGRNATTPGTSQGESAISANIHAGDTEPTDGSLVWIDTTEENGFDPEINSETWISGYTLNAQGGLSAVSDNTNNIAANYAFIPVKEKTTYTLYNAEDSTWTSDSVLIYCFSNNAGGDDEIITLLSGNPFRTTNGCSYILIASANLADEEYLNMRLVEGTTVPDSGSGDDSGDTGDDTGDTGGETEVTLTSISATYSGGDVTAGTDLDDLTDIVVIATYSDGSTATVTDYFLSGAIVEGENTITVSYGGMTTTFAVTGIVDSSGDDTGDSGGTETTGIVLNADSWKYGYFASGGSVTASSTSGEMYYDEYIPVTPGETYLLYNTNEEWTSDWNGIMFYTEDKTSLGRKSGTKLLNNRFIQFDTTETTAYIRPSSRNMTNYYETAAMCLYDDFPAPEMPFESAEWVNELISATGSISTTDEPMTTGLISVEAGATYLFANSNADYISGSGLWIGVAFYANAMPVFVSRTTSSYNVSSFEFTVPDGVKYARIIAYNISGYEDTATLEKIS